MEKVTNRLFKVTDDAGKERLVRGVDAKEIQAVAESNEAEGNSQSSLIDEADRMIKTQQAEAEKTAKSAEALPDLVEGATTTPQSLLKSNEPDFPVNDAMFRESQNNPDTSEAKVKVSSELQNMSRGDLEKRAKKHNIDGTGYPNRQTLAEAIAKAEK